MSLQISLKKISLYHITITILPLPYYHYHITITILPHFHVTITICTTLLHHSFPPLFSHPKLLNDAYTIAPGQGTKMNKG